VNVSDVGCRMSRALQAGCVVETSHSIATSSSPVYRSHHRMHTSKPVLIDSFLPVHATETKATPKCSECLNQSIAYRNEVPQTTLYLPVGPRVAEASSAAIVPSRRRRVSSTIAPVTWFSESPSTRMYSGGSSPSAGLFPGG
jgi:hypothetical protein